MDFSYQLLSFSILLFVSLFSSKLSSRFNMPYLLLFLGVGMFFGYDTDFSSRALEANLLGTIAMAFILFSGGFDTSWKDVRGVFTTGGILSSVGVLLTALFTGLFTWGIFRFFVPERGVGLSWCLLLGAVVSSTDAAAVFAILRSRSVSLRGKLQALLEFESGSNDPMATFLTLFMIGIIQTETQSGVAVSWIKYWVILPNFMLKMGLGILFGAAIGGAAAKIYNRINFEYNGLYYVFGTVIVLLVYSLTESCCGNGFMAVYVAGMTLGNHRFVMHNGVGRYFDGVAWMMQVLLFTMLGCFSTPAKVWDAKWYGLAVALFMMFIARPLAVQFCMIRSPFHFRERTLVSWVGLRGGAPIMLATFPLICKIGYADMMFNIVFFIVLTSVLIQGITIMPLARILDLAAPLHKTPRVPLSLEETGDSNAVSREVTLSPQDSGKHLAALGLPKGVLVLLIRRDDHFVVPRGDIELAAGDVLSIMGDEKAIQAALAMFPDSEDEEPSLLPPGSGVRRRLSSLFR